MATLMGRSQREGCVLSALLVTPKGTPRCCGVTLKGTRCKRAATAGKVKCETHDQTARPRFVYYVSKGVKPYRRRPDGSYHRHLIAKPFHSHRAAWEWMSANWSEITKHAGPGRRVVSCSVETFRVPRDISSVARRKGA